VHDLSPLRNLGISSLDLSNCSELADMDGGAEALGPLAGMTTTLEELDVSNCTSVKSVAPLRDLTELRTLILAGTGLSNLSPIRTLAKLGTLDLSNTRDLYEFTQLEDLKALKTLKLAGSNVPDLSPLRDLKLSLLDLSNCSNVANVAGKGGYLEPLRSMTTLKTLKLTGTNINDLSPLGELRLSALDLSDCTELMDVTGREAALAPLRRMTTLESLNITGCKRLTNLKPLDDLRNAQAPEHKVMILSY
jgi:Leucine-rich repeat (LRR) protein